MNIRNAASRLIEPPESGEGILAMDGGRVKGIPIFFFY